MVCSSDVLDTFNPSDVIDMLIMNSSGDVDVISSSGLLGMLGHKV